MPEIDAVRALHGTERRLATILQRIQSTILFRTQRALEHPRPKKSSLAPDVDDITYTKVLIDHQLARIGYGLEALDEEAAFDLALKFIQLHLRFALKREKAEKLAEMELAAATELTEAVKAAVAPIAEALPAKIFNRRKGKRS